MAALTREEQLEDELEKTLREKTFVENKLLQIIGQLLTALPDQKVPVKEAVSRIYDDAARLP